MFVTFCSVVFYVLLTVFDCVQIFWHDAFKHDPSGGFTAGGGGRKSLNVLTIEVLQHVWAIFLLQVGWK